MTNTILTTQADLMRYLGKPVVVLITGRIHTPEMGILISQDNRILFENENRISPILRDNETLYEFRNVELSDSIFSIELECEGDILEGDLSESSSRIDNLGILDQYWFMENKLLEGITMWGLNYTEGKSILKRNPDTQLITIDDKLEVTRVPSGKEGMSSWFRKNVFSKVTSDMKIFYSYREALNWLVEKN